MVPRAQSRGKQIKAVGFDSRNAARSCPSAGLRQTTEEPDKSRNRVRWYKPVYYAYILRCADDSFYVGSAQDLDSRVKAHNDGRGAAHTFKHRPVQLVYSEGFESEIAAVTRERQLKRWSHGKKQALVEGNIRRLKRLSKRRS